MTATQERIAEKQIFKKGNYPHTASLKGGGANF